MIWKIVPNRGRNTFLNYSSVTQILNTKLHSENINIVSILIEFSFTFFPKLNSELQIISLGSHTAKINDVFFVNNSMERN